MRSHSGNTVGESVMHKIVAIAGLVLVGAITPGPNNLIIINKAAKFGLFRALPDMTGIVLGGLVLLLGIIVCLGSAIAIFAVVRQVIVSMGCLYLAWLGLRLAAPGRGHDVSTAPAMQTLPNGLLGLFIFQFLNPKGWALVLTSVAATGSKVGTLIIAAQLVMVFALIPMVCVLLWSSLGLAMREHLEHPRVRKWFDRVMGMALLACALLLLVES